MPTRTPTTLSTRSVVINGTYEAIAAFIAGTASALTISSFTAFDLSSLDAALVGGGVATIEVVKEVAKEVRDRYRDKRLNPHPKA